MDRSPRQAASVILVRKLESDEPEVFLLRRHSKSGFMASSFVFPGGIAEDVDRGDARVTAARELFEEAGIYLGTGLSAGTLEKRRGRLHEDVQSAAAWLPELDLGRLHYWAHWITPSAEKRRYSARFFLAELPPGQQPSHDRVETVDQRWLSPSRALERCEELCLPPPQIHMLGELEILSLLTRRQIFEHCQDRGAAAKPILPRLHANAERPTLLLPWDPEYASHGSGEALEAQDHQGGGSRFVRGARGWMLCTP